MKLRIPVSAILMALSLGAVVAGRISTFDDTEGQALVNGWPYWLVALCFGGLAYLGARSK